MPIKIDKLIRSRRRTVGLIINHRAELVVRAPHWIGLNYINNFVAQRQSWIKKHQQKILQCGQAAQKKEFKPGERFLYLGREYILKISNGGEIALNEYLYFPQKFFKDPRQKMIAWYINQARGEFTRRAEFYSQLTGWRFKFLKISRARTRWGSCGAKNSINLNWRLILAPIEIIDYVVVHELAHTVEKNHSKRFWDRVEEFKPDYKKHIRWLRKNSRALNF